MTVTVIGGGASGMTAALAAAEAGASVTLLERQPRVGKKLYATGNGRCNLSHRDMGVNMLHGADPAFAAPALARFGVEATLSRFRRLGLLTVTEPSGRVYPLSDSAGSVLDTLRFALGRSGVHILCGAEALSAVRDSGGFAVVTAGGALRCDRLIVAAGGAASPKLGGGISGYELLRGFGHSVTALCPALVQLKCDGGVTRPLKGVRADALVRFAGSVSAESRGEVQFTDYGVSGPAVFEVSRAASVSGGGTLTLDLLRGLEPSEVFALITERIRAYPALAAENLFTGALQGRLGRVLVKLGGCEPAAPLSALSKKDAGRLAELVKCFSLRVTGTTGMEGAQVTAGGVRTSEFFPQTLESRLCKGLYACGEVLDIDGDCGGCNLQWAWSSGQLAGVSSAER